MKKTILIFLSLALIFGIFPHDAVYAKKNLEKNLEEITIKMKKIFSIDYDYENFDTRINSYDNEVRYSLNWNDNSKDIPDISIEVDEDENIFYYNKNYKTTEKDVFKNISKSKAKEIALDFIKKIAPEKIEQIKEMDYNRTVNNPQDNTYQISFYREVDGIPYYDNTLEVGIDKYKEEVVNFYGNWDYKVEFPNKNNAIKVEKAKETLKKDLSLELIYKIKYSMDDYGYDRDTEFYLVYDFLDANKAVDAISGKVIDVNRSMLTGGYGAESEDAVADEVLNPEEREEIEKLSGIKDIDEIEKTARKILEIEDGYKLDGSNLSTSWKNKDEYIWSLYFEKEGEDSNYTSIDLNAKTKDLINFYKYTDLKDKKPTIGRDEAFKLAKEYIKKTSPEKIENIEYMPMEFEDGAKNFNFKFIRKEGDIYIEEDAINIEVNAVDKSVFSYSDNWYNGKLPPKAEIIDKATAYEILFDQIGYELIYVKTWDGSDENSKEKIKLIYDTPVQMPIDIDAKTGKLLDGFGELYIPMENIGYLDIDKSYAKDKINALGEYGIGFRGEKFRPKENILQKDFLNLIWQYLNPYVGKTENIEKIYKDLLEREIIKEEEKDPESNLTKEQGVVFLIRAMDYGEVASLKGIYKEVFKDSEDVDERFIGHVNLAYGFKIIEGDGSTPARLNPKNKLTREDAGNIIYNYIFR